MSEEMGLDGLRCGEPATVTRLCNEGSIRRRLSDVGFTPGAVVRCVGESPFGDPRAYEIRGAVVAIRSVDAQSIRVIAVRKEEGLDGVE